MERHKYSVSPVTAVNKAAQLINYTLSDKKCNRHRYFSEDNRFPSEDHS